MAERVRLHVSFELAADREAIERVAKGVGRSFEEWRSEAVEDLREDLEREFGPREDWEPFDLSPFEITLSGGD